MPSLSLYKRWAHRRSLQSRAASGLRYERSKPLVHALVWWPKIRQTFWAAGLSSSLRLRGTKLCLHAPDPTLHLRRVSDPNSGSDLMDPIHRKILDPLQRDASHSIAEVAERVGLSQTPCWKRIQRLEAQGVIERRVALLNPEKPRPGSHGLRVSRDRTIIRNNGSTASPTSYRAMPEVLELYRMAGDVDYMLRVVVSDMAGLRRVLQTPDRGDPPEKREVRALRWSG